MANIDKLIQQASQFLDSKAFASAEVTLKKALRRNKHHLDANYLMGTCLASQGKFDDAVAHLNAALRLKPDSPYIHNNLGALHNYRQDYRRAAEHFRRALEIDPALADAHYNLATILKHTGDPDGAMAHYRQALRDARFSDNATAGMAGCLNGLGRHDDAQALLSPYFDSPGQNPVLLKAIADHLRHHDVAPAVLGRVKDALSRYLSMRTSGRSVEDASIHFALAHLQDRAGEYRQAFESYTRANRCKAGAAGEGDMRSRFEAALAALELPPAGHSGGPLGPVFIVGMPRSGSTLVEQILHAHSDTRALGECEFFEAALERVGLGRAPRPEQLPADVALALRQAYLDRAADEGDKLLVDKTLPNYLHAGAILQVFPNARFVATMRDPYSTCLSSFFQDFTGQLAYTHSLAALGRMHNSVARLVDIAAERFPQHFRLVDYDAFVKDPEPDIRSLIDYCGLDWQPGCLEFHKARRFVSTSSANQVTRPVYQDAVDRYAPYREYAGELVESLESGRCYF